MSAEQRAATAFNAIAIICVLLPAPWHWRTKNIGTLLFIFWATIGALVAFVNGIVWNDNVDNPSPVWCDVSSQPPPPSLTSFLSDVTGILNRSLCSDRNQAVYRLRDWRSLWSLVYHEVALPHYGRETRFYDGQTAEMAEGRIHSVRPRVPCLHHGSPHRGSAESVHHSGGVGLSGANMVELAGTSVSPDMALSSFLCLWRSLR